MADGYTDDRGYVTISTSGTYGKIIINGRTPGKLKCRRGTNSLRLKRNEINETTPKL